MCKMNNGIQAAFREYFMKCSSNNRMFGCVRQWSIPIKLQCNGENDEKPLVFDGICIVTPKTIEIF